LFAFVLLIGISAFAQSQSCIPTPSNPSCNPVVGGKGVIATPASQGDFRGITPDVTVTPNNKVASEGSPMPVCQPCHTCNDSVKGSSVDRQKLKDAIAAVFGLG
jgi:hypothetical protein